MYGYSTLPSVDADEVDEEGITLINDRTQEEYSYRDEDSVMDSNLDMHTASSSSTANVLAAAYRSMTLVYRIFYNAIGSPIQSAMNTVIPALHPTGGGTCVPYWCPSNSKWKHNTDITGSATNEEIDEDESHGLLVANTNIHPNSAAGTAATTAPVSVVRTIVVLCMCIAWIGVFASFIILLCTEITTVLGISNGTVGATMIALGSEVWDMCCV